MEKKTIEIINFENEEKSVANENTEIIENEKIFPMIALRGKVIFPSTFVNFDVGRQISLNAINKASKGDNLIFVSAQKNALVDNPKAKDVNRVGVVARIRQLIKMPGNVNTKVSIQALYRARIVSLPT